MDVFLPALGESAGTLPALGAYAIAVVVLLFALVRRRSLPVAGAAAGLIVIATLWIGALPYLDPTGDEADRLTASLLLPPSAEYRADLAALEGGAAQLADAGADPRPGLSPEEIAAAVRQVALDGGGVSLQGTRRAELVRLGRFQRTNAALQEAADRLDAAYQPLHACYASEACGHGDAFRTLCGAVERIVAAVSAVNGAGMAVPEVAVAGTPEAATAVGVFVPVTLANVVALDRDTCTPAL